MEKGLTDSTIEYDLLPASYDVHPPPSRERVSDVCCVFCVVAVAAVERGAPSGQGSHSAKFSR